MHRFNTPVPPRLAIDVHAGIVTIETAESTETTIDLQPRHDSANARELIAASTIEQRGEDIVVRVPRRHRARFGRGTEVALTITTPTGSRLSIETGSADVVANGQFATTTVATGSGDVELGEITDALRLRSGSGDIRVRAVAGDLDAQTGSGDVRIDSLTGAGSVQSGSGDITVGDCGRALRVKTGSGDVAVGAAPEDLRVSTASGDIRAAVRQGTAAWLDVRSIAGRITSALESGDGPAAGEQQARLDLETVSGDIDLLRV